MKSHLAILVLLITVVAQAESVRTIKPKPRPVVTAAKKEYRHLMFGPAPGARPAEPKDAVMRAIAVPKDHKFDISAAQRKQLERVVGRIRQNPQDLNGIGQEWTRFVKSLENHSKPIDLGTLMAHTIRTSVLETNGDLRFFAARAERLKSEIAGTRRLLAELRGLKRQTRSNAVAVQQVTPKMLDAEIAKWQQKLATIGDDAQLANIDLQNSIQKQAQTIQILSNIMKTLHDSAMAVIRNIR